MRTPLLRHAAVKALVHEDGKQITPGALVVLDLKVRRLVQGLCKDVGGKKRIDANLVAVSLGHIPDPKQ